MKKLQTQHQTSGRKIRNELRKQSLTINADFENSNEINIPNDKHITTCLVKISHIGNDAYKIPIGKLGKIIEVM